MNIRDATIKALTTGGYMYREDEVTKEGIPTHFTKPEKEVNGQFWLHTLTKEPKWGWQPNVEDLMSDDWEVMLPYEYNRLREWNKQ